MLALQSLLWVEYIFKVWKHRLFIFRVSISNESGYMGKQFREKHKKWISVWQEEVNLKEKETTKQVH